MIFTAEPKTKQIDEIFHKGGWINCVKDRWYEIKIGMQPTNLKSLRCNSRPNEELFIKNNEHNNNEKLQAYCNENL